MKNRFNVVDTVNSISLLNFLQFDTRTGKETAARLMRYLLFPIRKQPAERRYLLRTRETGGLACQLQKDADPRFIPNFCLRQNKVYLKPADHIYSSCGIHSCETLFLQCFS